MSKTYPKSFLFLERLPTRETARKIGADIRPLQYFT